MYVNDITMVIHTRAWVASPRKINELQYLSRMPQSVWPQVDHLFRFLGLLAAATVAAAVLGGGPFFWNLPALLRGGFEDADGAGNQCYIIPEA